MQETQGLYEEIVVFQVAIDFGDSVEKVRVREVEEGEDKDGDKVDRQFEFRRLFEQECGESEQYVQTEWDGAPLWRGGLRALYGKCIQGEREEVVLIERLEYVGASAGQFK